MYKSITLSKVKVIQGQAGSLESLINQWSVDNNISRFTVSIAPYANGFLAAISYDVTVNIPTETNKQPKNILDNRL